MLDLARRGPVAVRDDVGRHAGAVRPVLLVDVLDHALALVAGRQVEVDVRPLAALLGEEALEEELHLHRVDRRDRQRVADGAVGRGAAPLHEDPVLEAEAHDVPHDQEVAGEIELLDHRELLLDLGLGLRGQRAEARAGPVPGELAEVRGRRLAGRQRIVGKAVAEVRESEVEAPRKLRRGRDRPGQVREELLHLGGALEMPLALRREKPSRAVERRVMADARHHVVELLVPGARVADAVGGQERQTQPAREVDERLVAVLFLAQAMPLELDVESPREDRGEPLEKRHARRPGRRRKAPARRALPRRRSAHGAPPHAPPPARA